MQSRKFESVDNNATTAEKPTLKRQHLIENQAKHSVFKYLVCKFGVNSIS